MLIRLALWMIFLSLPFFLVAFTLKLAAFLLLGAFGLLILASFAGIAKQIWNGFRNFFSAPQRENRRVLFAQNKKNTTQSLFYFKRLQLNYFKECQRKKILEKNNRTHINALSKSIEQQLQSVNHLISKDLFSQLQLENRRYRSQQNEQALLELHQKISSLAGK